MTDLSHVDESGAVRMVDVGGKPLSLVEVSLEVVADGVEITAAAETTAQTGVEMEALTAASVAALTVYDMAKAIDKEMVIADVTLVEKTKAVV